MRMPNSLQFVSIAGGENFALAAYYLLERTAHPSLSCALLFVSLRSSPQILFKHEEKIVFCPCSFVFINRVFNVR